MEKKHIAIGKILGPTGLKGWLKVKNYSGLHGRFDQISKVWIHTDSGLRGLRVEKVKENIKGPIVKFQNIDSIKDAEKYNGCEILLDFDQRLKLPKDTFFIHDLIGLEVFNNNTFIGKVVDVISGPGNDIYVVHDENQREVLIPAISHFGNEVDLKNHRIDVKLIEGMIPENEN